MDYTKSRRSSLKASPSEFNEAFDVLVTHYGINWLEGKQGHPIQELWNRRDELATNELFALAISIKTLNEINPTWTKSQVQQSKLLDRKNMQGAIFELYCLTSVNNEKHPVVPANLRQAGYDGTLKFDDAKEMRVSIKNYGMSDAQKRFEETAQSIEKVVLGLLKKYDYPPVTIVIDSPEHYPEMEDWNLLVEHIDGIFKSKRNDPEPFFALVKKKNENEDLSPDNHITKWILLIKRFEDSVKYHPAYKTHTLIIRAKFHQHEYKNLYDRINEACFNLSKHSAQESSQLINSLFIHLPPNASIEGCYNSLSDYFNLYPEKPITMVILYQPTVATDIAKNRSFIHHCFKAFIRSERLALWNPKGPRFQFTFPIQGGVSQTPPVNTLIMDYPDGNRETSPIPESYLYQHGNHYLKMQPDGKGGFGGYMEKLGTGLFTHTVIEIPGQPGHVAVRGQYAPFDELLIL